MTDYVKHITPQQVAARKKKRPLLSRLDMELTERCNLDCIHCYINQPANAPDLKALEMDTGQVKSILNQAAELGCMTVRVTGGEPLLRPDFTEIYLHARRLGLRVLLFTNATLLTPELADMLARTPPLEKIEITVYGMSQESYAAVTGVQGAYRAVMRGIDMLLERQIPFVVKGALLPPNKHERDAFETWASTIPWMDVPPSYAVFFDLRTRRDQPEKQRQIKELRRPPALGLEALTRNPKKYRENMNEFCSKFMGVPGEKLFGCGAGLGGCVDAYGWMQPCIALRHPDTVWNLRDYTLRELLTDFFPQLRQRRATNPDYLDRCARCFLKGLCEQCPAKSWMEHGTLDSPVTYLCRVAHSIAHELGLLMKDEQGWEIQNWQERIASKIIQNKSIKKRGK